jgi:integrase
MSNIEKRGNGYYSNFNFKGQRIRRTLGTTDQEEAIKNCDKLRASLWDEHKKPKSERHTFTDAVALWLKTGDKSLSDRYSINAFNIGDKQLSELTESALEAILDRNQGSTRNRKINLLHAILNCALRRGWIDKIPHMQKVEVNDGRIRWLTFDEWQYLLSHLSGNTKQMARFAIATGMRENNVIELEWNQVDLQRKVAWLHADQTKSKKTYGVPLSDDAIQVLKEQIGKHHRYVFVYSHIRHGKSVVNIVTRASSEGWKRALVKSYIDVIEKIDKHSNKYVTSTFRWHDLRHTWASWHVQAGTPIEVLQKLGGWETLSMVLRYAHLAPEHLASYANNANHQERVAKLCDKL